MKPEQRIAKALSTVMTNLRVAEDETKYKKEANKLLKQMDQAISAFVLLVERIAGEHGDDLADADYKRLLDNTDKVQHFLGNVSRAVHGWA